MDTKLCSRCGTIKPLSEFSANKSRPDGLQFNCKECRRKYHAERRDAISEARKAEYARNKEKIKARVAKYREEHRDEVNAKLNAYYHANKETYSEKSRLYRERNREIVLARKKKYREDNAPKVAALNAKRASKRRRATYGDPAEILMWYELAATLSRGGVQYQVDHIVPLLGKTVSGLHAPWNLRVIPKHQNASKGNRWWPEELPLNTPAKSLITEGFPRILAPNL